MTAYFAGFAASNSIEKHIFFSIFGNIPVVFEDNMFSSDSSSFSRWLHSGVWINTHTVFAWELMR